MSRRNGLVLLITCVFALAAGSVALAKGPESVTMTGPGVESSIELMDSVEDWPVACEGQPCPPNPMILLMEQTGLWSATGDLPTAIRGEPEVDLGPRQVLTWIRPGFPDETVEKGTIRQFIYMEAEGGPYIHTPAQAGLEGWGGDVVGWFEAPDGLVDTLDDLGVPITKSGVVKPGSQNLFDSLGLVLASVAGIASWVLWFNHRNSDLSSSA